MSASCLLYRVSCIVYRDEPRHHPLTMPIRYVLALCRRFFALVLALALPVLVRAISRSRQLPTPPSAPPRRSRHSRHSNPRPKLGRPPLRFWMHRCRHLLSPPLSPPPLRARPATHRHGLTTTAPSPTDRPLASLPNPSPSRPSARQASHPFYFKQPHTIARSNAPSPLPRLLA